MHRAVRPVQRTYRGENYAPRPFLQASLLEGREAVRICRVRPRHRCSAATGVRRDSDVLCLLKRIRLSPLTDDGYPGLPGADLRSDGETERRGVFANQDCGP